MLRAFFSETGVKDMAKINAHDTNFLAKLSEE